MTRTYMPEVAHAVLAAFGKAGESYITPAFLCVDKTLPHPRDTVWVFASGGGAPAVLQGHFADWQLEAVLAWMRDPQGVCA